jgi:hypothetical protein
MQRCLFVAVYRRWRLAAGNCWGDHGDDQYCCNKLLATSSSCLVAVGCTHGRWQIINGITGRLRAAREWREFKPRRNQELESYASRFTSHSFRNRDKPEANQRAVPDLTQCASFHQGAQYHHGLQEKEDDKTHDPLLRRQLCHTNHGRITIVILVSAFVGPLVLLVAAALGCHLSRYTRRLFEF